MKKILSLTSTLLFVGAAGIAFSQTNISTPAASTAPAADATPMKTMEKGDHPRIKAIWERVRNQNERIKAGVKNGKLTKEEAVTLHSKVKSIREEMQSDIQSNGKRELTEDQFNQLNQELDANSTAIHDEKSEGTTSTTSSRQLS